MRTNNARFQVTVQSPLLRPGLSISASVSERYVRDTVERLMDAVRMVNVGEDLPTAAADAHSEKIGMLSKKERRAAAERAIEAIRRPKK